MSSPTIKLEPKIEVTYLAFKDKKTPYSSRFDDIYFAPSTGIEESTYIYLEGSGFLKSLENKKAITVAEMGFGVGLNFLLTLKAFLQKSNPTQTLHYLSFEKYPVVKNDLIALYSVYPELEPYFKILIEQYPVLTPGVHRLNFYEGRVILDLILGDANQTLSELEFKADHWYWDGFSPKRNPDAFSKSIFEQVARLSHLGAQGSSYTAASWVREEIEASGFQIEKRLGFGDKRESIVATLKKSNDESILPPWFSSQYLKKLNRSDQIAVIGAGLSGSAVARKLANLGYRVRVYDRNGIANRASGNSVGLFNVQLSKLPNPISRYSQLALTYFLRELKNLNLPHHLGILREDEQNTESLENSDFPKNFYEEKENGIFFPECGFLNPVELCKKRLAHPLIEVIEVSILGVEKKQDRLHLMRSDKKMDTDINHVIYAMGADLKLPSSSLHHSDLDTLPLRPIRGQTILIRSTEESLKLRETRVNQGYLSPIVPNVTGHDYHLIGATYQAKNIDPEQESLDSKQLLDEAKEKWPMLSSDTDPFLVSTKVGFRLSTPDKLPLIGPLCNAESLKQQYHSALQGAALRNLPQLKALDGEWLFLGMGSRGITFSSLGAEILVSMMRGAPLPLEIDLLEHLHSNRFLIRNLKKLRVN